MQAVEGMATSGVVVATMMASMSFVAMPDRRMASSAALKAMPEGRSSSPAQCRRQDAGDLVDVLFRDFGEVLRPVRRFRPRAEAGSRPRPG